MAQSYAEKLEDPRWHRKRREILERAGYMCERCGDSGHCEECETGDCGGHPPLQVHHGYYRGNRDPWEYENYTLWALCAVCHEDMDELRVKLVREIGSIHPTRLAEALQALSSIGAQMPSHVLREVVE